MNLLMTVIFYLSATFAHSGHDHDTPLLVQAPKGGIVKALEKTNVEVTHKGKELKIYLYDKILKPKSVEGFKIVASVELPRSTKRESVEFKGQDNFFAGSYDDKGVHRYTLWIDITDPATGHTDKLNYTIEPRK